jgi:hypothetical protein
VSERSRLAEYVAGVVDGASVSGEHEDLTITLFEGQVICEFVRPIQIDANGGDTVERNARHTAWDDFSYERGHAVGSNLREALAY